MIWWACLVRITQPFWFNLQNFRSIAWHRIKKLYRIAAIH
jgi:hypothetical protein